MCRLLGYAAPAATGVAPVLEGGHGAFHDLARLHSDGWGTAWREGGGTRVTVSSAGGWGDRGLRGVLEHDAATARIVHLRLASDGMARAPENTHPFLADGTAFAHNGSLEPLGPVERLVSARRAAEVRGTTDSERYFAAIRSRLDEGDTALEAAVEVAGALRAAYPVRSLNALLLTPHELIAIHASRRVPVPLAEFAARGVAPADLPRHHDECYYLMRLRRTPDGAVVVASSGLEDDGWEPLADESVTRIDLATRAVVTVPLHDAAGRRARGRRLDDAGERVA